MYWHYISQVLSSSCRIAFTGRGTSVRIFADAQFTVEQQARTARQGSLHSVYTEKVLFTVRTEVLKESHTGFVTVYYQVFTLFRTGVVDAFCPVENFSSGTSERFRSFVIDAVEIFHTVAVWFRVVAVRARCARRAHRIRHTVVEHERHTLFTVEHLVDGTGESGYFLTFQTVYVTMTTGCCVPVVTAGFVFTVFGFRRARVLFRAHAFRPVKYGITRTKVQHFVAVGTIII